MARDDVSHVRTDGRRGGIMVVALVLVVLGVLLNFTVIGMPVGLPMIFAGVLVGLYAAWKRGNIGGV